MRYLIHILFCAPLSILSVTIIFLINIQVHANDQNHTTTQTDSYDASFFTQFNPQTALDIVTNIPGFNLDTGEDVRGFGAGAGNVLIDGGRPTSKSGGLEDALIRIPASQVTRVELLRGSAIASEISGQSIVANIIRSQKSENIRWQAELELAPDGTINPIMESTYTGSIDGWESSLKLNGFKQKYPRTGTIERFSDQNELLFSEKEDRPSILTEIFLSGDARKKLGENALQLNSRLGWSKFRPLTDRKRFIERLPDDNPDSAFFSDYNSQFYEGELGIDLSTPLKNEWVMKAIGLTTHQHWWYTENTENEQPINIFTNGSRIEFERDTYETILRATFTKTNNPEFRPEFGGEITYNRLDGSIDVFNINSSGNETSSFVPLADVTVQETRGEIFGNLLWRPHNKWAIEGGLTIEASQIKVSGDATNKQSFVFYKPSLSLTYDFTNALQVRLTARRIVGQLSFNDFVSTANIVDGRVTTGNPQLQPDKTTRINAVTNYTFSEAGNFNLELFHEWKNDVLEFILLPNGIQGIANAGNAKLWGYNAALTLPISSLLTGAQIKMIAENRSSSFTDPVTNQQRSLTNITAPKIEINFRHNIPKHNLAWGIGFIGNQKTEYFYVSEIDSLKARSQWNAFVESSHFKNILVRFEINRIGKEKEIRERSFFNFSRAGTPSGFEITNRKRGTFLSLILNGQF